MSLKTLIIKLNVSEFCIPKRSECCVKISFAFIFIIKLRSKHVSNIFENVIHLWISSL